MFDWLYDIWRRGCCELNPQAALDMAKAQFGQVNEFGLK